MNWYYIKAPDKGAGNTRMPLYVEGESEEDAMEVASNHERYNVYDWQNPRRIEDTGKTEEEVKEMVSNVSGPNEMLRNDGTVMIRNSDGESLVRKAEN